jgi:hypothetical protein
MNNGTNVKADLRCDPSIVKTISEREKMKKQGTIRGLFNLERG